MKHVCLKFLLVDGSFLQTVVPEELARTMVDGYLKKVHPPVVGEVKGGGPLGEHGWAVETDKVIGVHYFDIPPQQLPPPQAPQAPGFGPRKVPPTISGLQFTPLAS